MFWSGRGSWQATQDGERGPSDTLPASLRSGKPTCACCLWPPTLDHLQCWQSIPLAPSRFPSEFGGIVTPTFKLAAPPFCSSPKVRFGLQIPGGIPPRSKLFNLPAERALISERFAVRTPDKNQNTGLTFLSVCSALGRRPLRLAERVKCTLPGVVKQAISPLKGKEGAPRRLAAPPVCSFFFFHLAIPKAFFWDIRQMEWRSGLV